MRHVPGSISRGTDMVRESGKENTRVTLKRSPTVIESGADTVVLTSTSRAVAPAAGRAAKSVSAAQNRMRENGINTYNLFARARKNRLNGST
jgi:hypothetical protein